MNGDEEERGQVCLLVVSPVALVSHILYLLKVLLTLAGGIRTRRRREESITDEVGKKVKLECANLNLRRKA